MALEQQRPAAGLLHHSDRGIQYAAAAYHQYLAGTHIIPSLSSKGIWRDHAPIKSFFHTLKTERVHLSICDTRDQAK